MALECQGAEDSLSPNICVIDSYSGERSVCTEFEFCDPRVRLGSDSENRTRESDIVKPGCWKLTSVNDEFGIGARRSIMDLPSALVSEILRCLDAKDLAIVSCVSTLLHSIASEHCGWKEFYCERWGLPFGATEPNSGSPSEKSWKKLFVEREFRSKAFMGRFRVETLYGHTEAVRSVFLLPSVKLIFTGGYDSVIRMWDMDDGLAIASSRPLGCTIRAVVADTELLVAAGTDAFLQCWRATEGFPHIFDIAGKLGPNNELKLWGHEGPVTCLALDSRRIYSGSWDMSVRVWDRVAMKCLKVLRHGDWVWSLVPRGLSVASTAGGDVYVWDVESGDRIEFIQNAHAGNAYSLARSYGGNLLFTGGDDGAIHMFEFMSHCGHNNIKKVAMWVPHVGTVHSLAFEFPWLVSASSDGRLSLIDIRNLLKSSRRSLLRKANQSAQCNVEPPQRMLHGFATNLFSVDIGADRIVCGGEEGVVRIWNFSDAIEIEQRIRALRGIRLENRMRRRKIQIEMSSKSGRGDQCSAVAKRNQMHGDRNAVWRERRTGTGKLKA